MFELLETPIIHTTINGRIDSLQSTLNNHTSASNPSAHSFSNISGSLPTSRLSGTISSGQIEDGTITLSDLNATAFAGWDQNAGDDFTQAQGDLRYSRLGHTHDSTGIADGAITSPKIVDGSVTTDDIADGTIRTDDVFQDETNPTSLDSRYVNETGDTMTCSTLNADGSCLRINGNINVTGTMNGVDVSQLVGILANKKTLTGSQDITSRNSAKIWLYQARESSPVKMFLIGGLFNQAHYTELARHSHLIRASGVASGDTDPGRSYDTGEGIDNSSGTTQLVRLSPEADYRTSYTGITTLGIPISTTQKTYVDGMRIFIDGTDRTANLLALADALNPGPEDWTSFGDGTASHAFNDTSVTDPGTGYMDVSSLFSTLGFHIIELRQSGNFGGKVSWVIQVD